MSVAEKTPPPPYNFVLLWIERKKKSGFVVTKLQICSSTHFVKKNSKYNLLITHSFCDQEEFLVYSLLITQFWDEEEEFLVYNFCSWPILCFVMKKNSSS